MKFLLVAINAKYIHSNPGIYSLKAYAEAGHGKTSLNRESSGSGTLCAMQVEIAEYTINNQMERILEDIYLRKPDVVGISCYIWNVEYARNLIHDLHKVLPDTDIWLGGPEVSFDAPQLLEQEPEVLGVMKGEGEETFAMLIDNYEMYGGRNRSEQSDSKQTEVAQTDSKHVYKKNASEFYETLHEIPGVTFRDEEGKIWDYPIRPVMDMSQIPFLYGDLKDFTNRIIYYESSRGCPFSCSYCLSSIDKSVRFRDLELVKKELDFFLENQVPQVKFVDRTFNCKKSHAMEIWKHILEHDNGVTNFHFEIAADLLDEEELELIGKMRPGLIQLEIGVQSTNMDTIKEIHRRMDLQQVKEVVARINEGKNVHQHLDLIAGLPYEDYDSFHRSFNDVYAMEPEQLQLGFLKVLKGSFMYENAKAYDLVYRDLPPYEVLSTRWLPYGDVLRLKSIEDMVEVYYNSRQFTETLAILESEFADAFTMFEALAAYYEEKHYFGLNHSRLARYEILHDFIDCIPERKHKMEEYGDSLTCDLYRRENAKSRPTFALDQLPYKEQIRTLVSDLRTLGTRVHVEVLNSGDILLFDYREKDPLNHNAKVTKIGRAES